MSASATGRSFSAVPNDVATLSVAEPEALAAPVITNQTVAALPTPVDLILYAGDDFYLDLTVTYTNGDPADLSEATASAQVRSHSGSTGALLATFACTIVDNVVTLHLTHDESTDLVSGVWDAQIATPDITTLAGGKVSVVAEVTTP